MTVVWLMMFAMVAQPVLVPVAAEVQLSGSMIAAIVAGVVAIIGALAAGAVKIIAAVNATKQTVNAVTHEQNQKLDNITILVDGRYSNVLTELAEMKEMFARVTGRPSDKRRAEESRAESDAQEARVHRAEKTS